MPADAQIRITAENQTPQAFRQVDQSLKSLDQQTRAVQSSTRQSAAALGLFDDEARRTRGATASLTRDFGGASRGAGILTNSLGGLTSILGALGIAAVSRQLVEFAQGSVRAAGRLELLTTGLTNVTGSSAAAEQRLRELDAIARLPGANLDALIQYNNRLTAIGLTAEETDSILLNVGQSIVSLGGNAILAEQSLEQISQALQNNIVDLRDFRPLIQRVPGVLQAIADVHGVAPSLEGLREAVARLGGSVKDALLPVLEELGNRFAAPPPESYVRSVDELQNSFFLFQATLGDWSYRA